MFTNSGGTPADHRGYLAPTKPPTAKALAMYLQRLHKAAADAGARVAELRVLRAGSVSVALTLRVTDPAAFLLRRSDRLIRLHEAGPRILGYYIALEDRTGTVVWAGGRVASGGESWIRPDLAGCDPLLHIDVLKPPPPCPA